MDSDGEMHDKLHLHWRLKQPARSPEDLNALKAARERTTRLVGGDSSNNPVCHPIRWPGSWHRKSTPRLCTIVAANPDAEIALTEAIGVLPPPPDVSRQAHTPGDWLTFLDSTYEGSSRGSAVARYAGLLFRTYLDPRIIESTVRLFNAQRCNPALPPDEVEHIVREVAQRHADQLNRQSDMREASV
jgi:hypothetical protein